jgi:hypothetical protein
MCTTTLLYRYKPVLLSLSLSLSFNRMYAYMKQNQASDTEWGQAPEKIEPLVKDAQQPAPAYSRPAQERCQVVIYTGARVIHTGARVIHTGARVIQTGARVIHTGARVIHTGARVIHTGARVIHTGARVIYIYICASKFDLAEWLFRTLLSRGTRVQISSWSLRLRFNLSFQTNRGNYHG